MEMAQQSPIGKIIKDKNIHKRPISRYIAFMATFILQEFKKESQFKEYLDTLPKNLYNFPIFFSEEEKEWLNGSLH